MSLNFGLQEKVKVLHPSVPLHLGYLCENFSWIVQLNNYMLVKCEDMLMGNSQLFRLRRKKKFEDLVSTFS